MAASNENDCVFCKILRGEIPAALILDNNAVAAFADIHPQAPVHFLVIPKKHVAGVREIGPGDGELLAEMTAAANQLAEREGIAEEGYRLVINSGDNGGQTVYHLHMHVLGGRVMRWPPG